MCFPSAVHCGQVYFWRLETMQKHVLLRLLVILAATAAAYANGPIRVGHGARHRPLPKTLVFYVHAAQPMARSNLLYFLEHGVHPGDGASYYFVLQSNFTTTTSCLPPFAVAPLSITEEFGVLPSNLPTNVRYIVHENDCYDLGTFGWFIQCGYADMTAYKYFIILNSSVRGPFLPAYVPWLHWAVVFIQFITDHVKLVGAAGIRDRMWACKRDPHGVMGQRKYLDAQTHAPLRPLPLPPPPHVPSLPSSTSTPPGRLHNQLRVHAPRPNIPSGHRRRRYGTYEAVGSLRLPHQPDCCHSVRWVRRCTLVFLVARATESGAN